MVQPCIKDNRNCQQYPSRCVKTPAFVMKTNSYYEAVNPPKEEGIEIDFEFVFSIESSTPLTLSSLDFIVDLETYQQYLVLSNNGNEYTLRGKFILQEDHPNFGLSLCRFNQEYLDTALKDAANYAANGGNDFRTRNRIRNLLLTLGGYSTRKVSKYGKMTIKNSH